MRVCFSVGPMSSKLINSIARSADNVEFFTYSNIADMIKESTMRHVFFDRIVFSEKILSNSNVELEALNNYISEFSDNTKIVFICQGRNDDNVKLFSSYFDSPLYTVVLAEKVTTSILLEFVRGDIAELKAKYFSLDFKETKAVTSKYLNDSSNKNNQEKQKVKSEKKGFFKSLFGNKKNSTKKVENKNDNIDTPLTEGNSANVVSQNILDKGISNISADTSIGDIMASEEKPSKIEMMSSKNSSENASGSVGAEFSSKENILFGNYDDSLGIGDLGEQHVDTGYLDEEEANKIDEELKLIDDVDNSNKVSDSLNSNKDSMSSKYRLVIGERGIGATSYIVDYSVNKVNSGKKVLIIDLDTIDNGILSYIDSDMYYNSGAYNGIDNISVYTEEGVDLISNGYGREVSESALNSLLSSDLLDKYDLIFIDCPIDCIGNLSTDLVSKCMTMIKVGGNKGSLLSLLNKLTSRIISPEIEDLLFQNSKFDIINKIQYYSEDISFLKKSCFFGRGNWLSKIS